MSVTIVLLSFSAVAFTEGKKKGMYKTEIVERKYCQITIDERVKIEMKKKLNLQSEAEKLFK